MSLFNYLGKTDGGQIIPRYGKTDTETGIEGGNYDRDRATKALNPEWGGFRRSVASTVNNAAGTVDSFLKTCWAPVSSAITGAKAGPDWLAAQCGFEKPGVITGILGRVGGFMAGGIFGTVKIPAHGVHTLVNAGQTVLTPVYDGVNWLVS